jgi:hypothetical protein
MPRRVLRLNRQLHGLTLRHLVLGPQTLEQLKAQIAAKRAFDHLAVAFARASRADFHQPQDCLVEGYCRSDLWHLWIMAKTSPPSPP